MILWHIKRARASVWADLVLWTLWILVLVLAIILPLYLGLQFLVARNCNPHFNLTITGSQVRDFIPLDLLKGGGDKDQEADKNKTVPEVQLYVPKIPKEDDTITDAILNMFPAETPLRVSRNNSVLVARIPRTLYRKTGILAKQQIYKYNLNDIPASCTINEHRDKRGLISLGLTVCQESIYKYFDKAGGEDGMDENMLLLLKTYLASLPVGTENDLVKQVQKQDVASMITKLPVLFPSTGINETHVASLQTLISPFSEAELLRLVSAFSSAGLTEADLNVINHIMTNKSQEIDNVTKVLKKIDPNNIGPINENLDSLGIGLDAFISDIGVVLSFWGRDELVRLQELLPTFEATDVEAMIIFGQTAEEAQKQFGDPNDKPLFEKLFALPLDVLLGSISKLKFTNETLLGMEAVQLIMEDPTFLQLQEAGLKIMNNPESLMKCVMQDFNIICRDDKKDYCPIGQMFLTLLCWFPLMIPGLVYAVSCLMHYRGSILQCGIGKPFQMPRKSMIDFCSAWLIVLPAYLLAMIPFTLILIVYRQIRVWYGLLQEARGYSQPLEPDSAHLDQASSFGFLLGAGQGILHLGFQAVLLGVVLLAGDILLGLDKEFYVYSTSVVTVISMVMVVLTLVVSQISSQESHRLNLDLPTPPRSKLYLFGSLVWVISSLFFTIVSTLVLVILIYIDTVGFSQHRMCLISFLILLLLPPVQCLVYQLCVKSGAEHRFAWGLFSSVVPVRFLHLDRSRTKLFLVYSQTAWFLIHSGAWILYAISVQVEGGGDVVWRTWMPVIIPSLAIPTLLSFLHYSTSLLSIYSSPHAHPDMMDSKRRASSFPPDWNKMTGSSLPAKSLAEVGFFYSCKRLKFGEATCFSCGRQVSEWTSKSANELHKSVSDANCPLEKSLQEIQNEEDVSPSSLPKWIFVTLIAISRLMTIALFIWVFEEAIGKLYTFLPMLVMIPVVFLIVILLLNPSLYFVMLQNENCGHSVFWGILSPLVPNPSSTIQYIVANSIVNTVLYILVWGAMFGTSHGVALLASQRMASVWPVLLVLGALSLLSIIPYWCVALKPVHTSRKTARSRPRTTAAVVSTSFAVANTTIQQRRVKLLGDEKKEGRSS